jgi:hypothetical protein
MEEIAMLVFFLPMIILEAMLEPNASPELKQARLKARK